jgi:xylose isomerase
MKEWKFTANAGFFGPQRDRFNQYQPNRTLEEKIALVAQVEGITGIELKYPADFADVGLARALIADHGLVLSAVNVDTKDVGRFRHGALSNRQAETRQQAIQRLREGMDLAADLGVELVTTCPLSDGYDYPFQVDYGEAWGNFIETVRAVVAHRSDVTFLLEFQPHEPHAHIMLDSVGKVLHVCAEVVAPNLGANLDVGHAFAAGEAPAESAALLARKGLLRYIHSNDNTGDGGDWDMISGAVHFWHWIELIYTLQKVGYDSWIGGDIAPKHVGPVEVFRTNVTMIQRMTRLLERVGFERIAELVQQEGNIAAVYNTLSAAMLP